MLTLPPLFRHACEPTRDQWLINEVCTLIILAYFPASSGAPALIWEINWETRWCHKHLQVHCAWCAISNRLRAAVEVIVMTTVSEVCSVGIHHSHLPFPTAAMVLLDEPLLK